MKWLWPLVLMAACAKPPEIMQSPGDMPGLLRNPTAPLASQADVTAARLEGEWYVRKLNGSDQQLYDSFTMQGDEALLSLSRCSLLAPGGIDCGGFTQLTPVGPGRWQSRATDDWPAVPNGELWVLWMDFDSRTVVIGDPLGRYVWVLDRKPEGGADRIAAARDILKWYGYDLSRLESVQ